MDVIKAIRTEPSTADFSEQPVPDKVILQIIDAGHKAQSLYGSQLWRFIAVRDLDTLRVLSVCGRYSGHISEAAFVIVPVTEKVDSLLEGQIVAYMQLAAWDFGIGSCLAPITDPGRFRMLLHIPASMVFNLAVSFGVPERLPVKVNNGKSLPIQQVVKWEHW